MIRAHTLVQNYQYVSQRDDAVARPPEDDAKAQKEFEERWKRYLEGAEGPPLREGSSPTVFHLRHLRATEKDALSPFLAKMGDDPSQWLRACFAAASLALVKADNWEDAEGAKLKVQHRVEDGVRVASAETMNLLGYDLVLEIGGHVIAKLSADPK